MGKSYVTHVSSSQLCICWMAFRVVRGMPCLGRFSLWRFSPASHQNPRVALAGKSMQNFQGNETGCTDGESGDWSILNTSLSYFIVIPHRVIEFSVCKIPAWANNFFANHEFSPPCFFLGLVVVYFDRTCLAEKDPEFGKASPFEWEDVQREAAGGWVLERPGEVDWRFFGQRF